MPAKMNGLLSTLRLVWADLMPLSRGVSFTTQDFLEDRVSELEQENDRLRQQLTQLQGWQGEDLDWPGCRI